MEFVRIFADFCKQYLKSEGIIDEGGMIELLEL